MSVTEKSIAQALSAIADPQTGQDIVSAGLVRAVAIESGAVRFVLEIGDRDPGLMEPVRQRAEATVQQLAGVSSVSAAMTAPAKQKAPPSLKIGRHPTPERAGPQKLPGIDHVIAIASGKGGVGKSTLSANLAVALAMEGRRVGLLDADVYGPSQPRMLGVSGRPASPDGKTIIPLRNHGVTMMSLGLMTKEGEAVVWRGPMLMGALQQMLGQVEWGELDVLLVDLPPGTGDVQLTLAQKTQLDGAIVISTPQDVALLDARKGIDMFNKTKTPILGLIENMSTHICSNCGHEEHLFGHGGVANEARQLGVPLLAEIPLHIDIRLAADAGTPIVMSQPESPAALAYRDVAKRLVANGVA
jgi:ATP-binding protein involved in chromosome partitioning